MTRDRKVSGPTARQRIFLASVFDDALRDPILARCKGSIWNPVEELRGRTIEDVCREQIRNSRAFVALLDHRSGRALAFENVATPVTVLEIELLQALFQQMPVYIFTLPGFAANERLRALVNIAARWGLARVFQANSEIRLDGKSEPNEQVVSSIQSIADGHCKTLATELGFALKGRLQANRTLDIEFLNRDFGSFCDDFQLTETDRLIRAAAVGVDHASRLALLWAAMRQLSAAPYTQDECSETKVLWEEALSIWIRSAAWYGLHNDSPLGMLAAVNSLIWIRARRTIESREDTTNHPIYGTRGARASALYSMAKRSWRLLSRRKLLFRALDEVEADVAMRPVDLAGYIAIRGSIRRSLGQFGKAVSDHERVVTLRSAGQSSLRELGEALTELGWTYTFVLRFHDARQNLAHGVELMHSESVESPEAAGFVARALRKFAIVLTLALDFAGARRAFAESQRLARQYLARDQERRFFWL